MIYLKDILDRKPEKQTEPTAENLVELKELLRKLGFDVDDMSDIQLWNMGVMMFNEINQIGGHR